MKREDKTAIIDQLTERIDSAKHFYITDIGGLDAEQTSDLRRQCYKEAIELTVVKNTLLKKALENAKGDFEEMYSALAGPTSLMFTENASSPARLIQEFKKKKFPKPELKAAFAEESVYVGVDQLDLLSTIKSKEELIADLIALLQSPIRNVMSSLDSGKNILAGVVKTLSEKEN
ncbi:MAG: 50S ribosomal protein L10 [Bacteroidetes bacterium]|jgi:large subunit ribosomal protein L10|nr:50S ribosomal protein L10 [Bacteroidota bacterium]MBT3751142.1 50S ribosomal protein L10 [Bacteroidota bacterium]MBT4399685.1 50S ribosomal protein L10 [Bacteroidota bacterium]MBT4409910.1 50S ribosomal protein L10 [Bacteroidota bacterium]MBT5425357.1 50S ribosomal protein L10 [Bacteroidota bacterium]